MDLTYERNKAVRSSAISINHATMYSRGYKFVPFFYLVQYRIKREYMLRNIKHNCRNKSYTNSWSLPIIIYAKQLLENTSKVSGLDTTFSATVQAAWSKFSPARLPFHKLWWWNAEPVTGHTVTFMEESWNSWILAYSWDMFIPTY